MPTVPPKTAELLHRAAVAACAAFAGHIILYKLGWRGKFEHLDGYTSWAQVAQAMPKHVAVGLVAGLLVLLLWPRR